MKVSVCILLFVSLGINGLAQHIGQISIHRKKPFINSEEIDDSGGFGAGFTHRFNKYLGMGFGARFDGYNYGEVLDRDIGRYHWTVNRLEFKSKINQMYVAPVFYFPMEEAEISFFLEAELGYAYHSVKGKVLKETEWFYLDYPEQETETVLKINENLGRNFYWAFNIGIQIMPLENKNRFGVNFYLGYSTVDYSKTGNRVFEKLKFEKQNPLTAIGGGVTVCYALYK